MVCAAGLLCEATELNESEVGLAVSVPGVVTLKVTGMETLLATLPVAVRVIVPL